MLLFMKPTAACSMLWENRNGKFQGDYPEYLSVCSTDHIFTSSKHLYDFWYCSSLHGYNMDNLIEIS